MYIYIATVYFMCIIILLHAIKCACKPTYVLKLMIISDNDRNESESSIIIIIWWLATSDSHYIGLWASISVIFTFTDSIKHANISVLKHTIIIMAMCI